MKAILQFTLPAEEAEFKAAQQGRDAKLALWQIDQRLREILKYGTPTKEEQRLAQEIRESIPADLLED